MEPSLFKHILRHSGRDQLRLVLLTLAAFPFLYFSLELPKLIINRALAGSEQFPVRLDWLEVELAQIPYLLTLCVLFLALVFVNGGFKYAINVYSGVVGERMLRWLRDAMFRTVMRFSLAHFRKVGQGEIVAMVVAETEPLAGFIGESVKVPVFQGGTLVTILVFMFAQDWVLGGAAILLYPFQAYLVPRLQRRLNELRREITIARRQLSERIGEVVGSIQEVHAHATAHYEGALFTAQMDRLYAIRLAIFKRKYFIKFLNNFLAQVTPFFFYSIGGVLVIWGELSFGALVAVLAAYKDLNGPWKELLSYYQQKEDARIKYDLLYETFQPEGLLPASMLGEEPDPVPELRGALTAVRVDLRESTRDGAPAGTVSFRLDLPCRVLVLGPSGGGAERLGAVMARLRAPAAGNLSIGTLDFASLPEAVTGRRIAYAGQDTRLRAGSLLDNLLYVLHHRSRPSAALSGDARWIDHHALRVDGEADLISLALEAVIAADLDEDLYQLGLRGIIDPATHAGFARDLMRARAELRERLVAPALHDLVEPFDETRYNDNMTVAENLLFGTPRDGSLDIEALGDSPYVRRVLHETGLMPAFLAMGRELAELMVELFSDVAPDSELFDQFSFISGDDLPRFRHLLARTAGADLSAVEDADRRMLLSLPFKLVPARHRLGLIDGAMRERILAARKVFAAGFGLGSPPVDFFDRRSYNARGTIQDNVLFGRLTHGRIRSTVEVGRLIREVLDGLGLTRAVMEVGLSFSVGVGGSRLSGSQRQKLAIARALLKQPDILIIDNATAALDRGAQQRILERVLAACEQRTLIWLGGHAKVAESFDAVLVIDGGRVVEQGTYRELARPGTVFHRLLAEG